MITLWATLAGALLTSGAACLYLTANNQRALSTPLPAGRRAVGWVCLAASLVTLLCVMGPATAVFTWTVGLMAVWTISPIAIAWLRHRQGSKA